MLPKRNLEYLKNRNTAPQRMSEIVFDSPNLTVRKIMHWDDANLYRSFFADYFKLILCGNEYALDEYITKNDELTVFIDRDGDRVNDIYLDSHTSEDEGGYTLVWENGKYGYLDRKGHICIPLMFRYGTYFDGDYAYVEEEDRGYFINRDGREVELMDPYGRDICMVGGEPTTNGYNIAQLRALSLDNDYEDLYYTVSYDGTVMMEHGFSGIDYSDNNLLVVFNGDRLEDEDGEVYYENAKYGIADIYGNILIDLIYDNITVASHRIGSYDVAFFVTELNGKNGIISKEGKELVAPILEDVYDVWPGNGTLLCTIDGKRKIYKENVGFIDVSGEPIHLVDDRVVVERDGLSYLYDLSGKCLSRGYESINPQNDYQVTSIVDGHEYNGMIDKDGNEVIPCSYQFGVTCSWSVNKQLFVYDERGLKGLKTFDEKTVIEPKFADAKIYEMHDFLSVRVFGSKEGLADLDGHLIIEPVYDYVMQENDGLIIANADSYCDVYEYTYKNQESSEEVWQSDEILKYEKMALSDEMQESRKMAEMMADVRVLTHSLWMYCMQEGVNTERIIDAVVEGIREMTKEQRDMYVPVIVEAIRKPLPPDELIEYALALKEKVLN